MKSYSESYKNAGVDITAGYKAVELMKENGINAEMEKSDFDWGIQYIIKVINKT